MAQEALLQHLLVRQERHSRVAAAVRLVQTKPLRPPICQAVLAALVESTERLALAVVVALPAQEPPQ